MYSSIDETKPNLKLTPPPYKNNQDYVLGTDDKTCEYDDSPSDTGGCAILMMNIKIKKMTITLTLHLKK